MNTSIRIPTQCGGHRHAVFLTPDGRLRAPSHRRTNLESLVRLGIDGCPGIYRDFREEVQHLRNGSLLNLIVGPVREWPEPVQDHLFNVASVIERRRDEPLVANLARRFATLSALKLEGTILAGLPDTVFYRNKESPSPPGDANPNDRLILSITDQKKQVGPYHLAYDGNWMIRVPWAAPDEWFLSFIAERAFLFKYPYVRGKHKFGLCLHCLEEETQEENRSIEHLSLIGTAVAEALNRIAPGPLLHGHGTAQAHEFLSAHYHAAPVAWPPPNNG